MKNERPPSMSRVRFFFQKIFLINDSPHKVAAGAALGIFLGIFPGEGLASTLILSSVFKLNRLAASAGVLATNMWTTIIFLPLAAMIGASMFGKNYGTLLSEYRENIHLGFAYFVGKAVFLDLTAPLLAGFFVVALLVSIGFYVVLYILLLSEHRKKEHVFLKGPTITRKKKRPQL